VIKCHLDIKAYAKQVLVFCSMLLVSGCILSFSTPQEKFRYSQNYYLGDVVRWGFYAKSVDDLILGRAYMINDYTAEIEGIVDAGEIKVVYLRAWNSRCRYLYAVDVASGVLQRWEYVSEEKECERSGYSPPFQ